MHFDYLKEIPTKVMEKQSHVVLAEMYRKRNETWDLWMNLVSSMWLTNNTLKTSCHIRKEGQVEDIVQSLRQILHQYNGDILKESSGSLCLDEDNNCETANIKSELKNVISEIEAYLLYQRGLSTWQRLLHLIMRSMFPTFHLHCNDRGPGIEFLLENAKAVIYKGIGDAENFFKETQKIIEKKEWEVSLQVQKQPVCSLCNSFYFPAKPQLKMLNLDELQVQSGGGSCTIPFTQATRQYFDHHFPNATSGVFSIPAAEIKKTDQSNTALDVKLLQDWGASKTEGLFIFKEYKYDCYLKKAVLPGQHCVTKESGDFDYLLIGRYIGVIHIEVKGTRRGSNDKTKKHKLRDAQGQIRKGKYVFYEMNRDLDLVRKLPFYSIIVTPYLTSKELLNLGTCPKDLDHVISSDMIENVNDFNAWFDSHICISEEPVFAGDSFSELVSRFVGLASLIEVPTLSSAIVKVHRKVGKYLLTPEQQGVINDESNQFIMIAGDYGTGKSLVCAAKARSLSLNTNNPVNLITCADTSNGGICHTLSTCESVGHLMNEKYPPLKENMKDNSIRLVRLGELLREFCINGESKCSSNSCAKQVTAELFLECLRGLVVKNIPCHIILDEVPFHILRECFDPLSSFVEALPNGTTLWISIMTNSYRIGDDDDPKWVEKEIPSNFKFVYLSKCMRMTRNILALTKSIEAVVGKGHHSHSQSGYLIPTGPIPLLYHLPSCECGCESNFYSCFCIVDRLRFTFKAIFDDLHGVRYDQMKVLVSMLLPMEILQSLISVIWHACELLDVPVHFNTLLYPQSGSDIRVNQSDVFPKGVLSVVDVSTFLGCESPVVINLDPFGMNHLFKERRGGLHTQSISRAQSQYVHVTWPKEEAKTLWLNHLTTYENLICGNPKLGVDDVRQWMRFITDARKGNGECLKIIRHHFVVKKIKMRKSSCSLDSTRGLSLWILLGVASAVFLTWMLSL